MRKITHFQTTILPLTLPSFTTISQWGHFFFTGGLLIIGCLVLGLSLLRNEDISGTTSYVLIAAAILHLIGQLCALLLPIVALFTGVLFFIALVWFGISMMLLFSPRGVSFTIDWHEKMARLYDRVTFR